jgi:MYXO-CTERM domain-containing protein
MRRLLFVASISSASLISISASADTLQVGPGKTYVKVCDAIAAAKANDTIQVDASGTYDGENCSWDTDGLTVTGVNGRPKINLTSAPSNDKGIFTITAANATIENFEFSGATSSSSNGAGIRHQGLNLTVRGCYFHDNQDGILGAPATDQSATPQPGMGTILVETSEFSHNGAGDGESHNMYIGDYGSFTLRASYSHGAVKGNLVKSRAYKTYVLYNRITDEPGTTASYEIDIPNAGTTYVIGNVIEQSAESENDNIIETGAEGASNPTNQLFVVNDTIVNDQANGTFVDASGAAVTIINTITRGAGTLTNAASPTLANNWDDTKGDPLLVDQANFDYHLQSGSPCVDQGKDPGNGPDMALNPIFEYVHPTSIEGRTVAGNAIDIGAYELGGAVALGDGGIDAIDSGIVATDSDAGASTSRAPETPSSGTSSDSSGCGCSLVGTKSNGTSKLAVLLAAFAILVTKRFRRRPFVRAHAQRNMR